MASLIAGSCSSPLAPLCHKGLSVPASCWMLGRHPSVLPCLGLLGPLSQARAGIRLLGQKTVPQGVLSRVAAEALSFNSSHFQVSISGHWKS